MAEDTFRLPRSSYDEVVKIIQAYAEAREDAALDDIATLSAINRTVVSGNNAFLKAVGIIEGGNRKTVTQEGKELGLALQHQIQDTIRDKWCEIALSNEFMQKILSAVRIRQGMDPDTLQSHIAYSAGQRKTRSTSTGATTIITILEVAGLLKEEDGTLIAPKKHLDQEKVPIGESVQTVSKWDTDQTEVSQEPAESDQNVLFPSTVFKGENFQILLNIQLQLQASSNELEDLVPKLKQLIQEMRSIEESELQSGE